MPPPLPPWKRQLNLKLDTYRSRQQARQETDDREAPAPEMEPPIARPPANVIKFQFPEGTEDGPETEMGWDRPIPNISEKWRRVERPEVKLPPLVRNVGTRSSGARDEIIKEPPAETSAPEPAPHVAVRSRTAPVRARLIAGVLDVAVVLLALGVFIGVFQTIGGGLGTDSESFRTLFSVFLGLLFFYWTFYLRYIGETAGMTWMRLRVVTFEGKTPSPIQKWVRTAGTILSFCAAGLGFFWALADEEKLTWHDRMSRTYITDGAEAQSAVGRSKVRLARPRARTLPRAARRA